MSCGCKNKTPKPKKQGCGCRKKKCKVCGCNCGCNRYCDGCGCAQRAYISQCEDCNPCKPKEEMVKICTFVAPTLEDARYYRNSFVFVQEDDSVYYISDDGTDTPFGSRPIFKDDFNPLHKAIPRQTVYDFKNNIGYVYSPDGKVRQFALTEVENAD